MIGEGDPPIFLLNHLINSKQTQFRAQKQMRIIFLLLLFLFPTQSIANPTSSTEQNSTSSSSHNVFNERPLMERYVMDELKSLRQEVQSIERRAIEKITNRELKVAEQSLNYANIAVTYFFYLIAAAASIIALVGWQSLREIKTNAQQAGEKQIKRISEQYEQKFHNLEKDLRRKTQIILKNNQQIEEITEIHNLWLRVQSAQTESQKIALYDEILRIRPGDLEALTHKADSALAINEYRWALSLCNRVLEVDTRNAPALYQRACAHARLQDTSRALSDLTQAITLSSSLRGLAVQEEDFDSLRGMSDFEALLGEPEERDQEH